MRAVTSDLRRAFAGRWFFAAVFASMVMLWLGIGHETYRVLHFDPVNGPPDWAFMLQKAAHSQSSMLSLPVLAALPYGAGALHEMRSGAMRMRIFRAGRACYIAGKAAACLLSGAAVQLGGYGLLALLLYGIHLFQGGGFPLFPDQAQAFGAVGARCLAGGMFALFGGGVALLSGDAVAAYVSPMALGFTFTMLGSRFFTEAAYLNPASWVSGERGALFLIGALLAVCLFLYVLLLRLKVRAYA